jgi:DNA-binding NarL/FixJ family response regulator
MNNSGVQESQNAPARLVIADDHELVRDGLQRMLSGEQDLEIVAEATNGREALDVCRKLRPDLVLMDVRMPQMDGLEATRAIKGEMPATSVLIVTTHESPDYLFEAVEAGAAGYVLKDAPKRQLINAARRTLNGESPLNQELAMQLIQRFAGERRVPKAPNAESYAPEVRGHEAPSSEGLTNRELEVLRLMARGQTNAQIASELVISVGTSKTHVQHIIGKLGVSDRTQAVVRAIEAGIVVPGVAEERRP